MKNIQYRAPRAKPVLLLYRYAQMNILIESNFVMFYRRIHVPKYNVPNIISNSLITNRGYLLFGGEYQIYFIECGEKISVFHECVARVKMLIFSPHEMKYILYLP